MTLHQYIGLAGWIVCAVLIGAAVFEQWWKVK